MTCPCGSSIPYKECCEKYHKGKLPETALLLMKSRYTAYAKGLAPYIIETTHPENPCWEIDRKKWIEKILQFSKNTQFESLEIIEFIETKESATVTFIAHLSQKGQDATFKEKSLFEKLNGRWLYKDNLD